MRAVVSPGQVDGTITPPSSKSHFQRVCAAAFLAGKEIRITRPGVSADDEAAVRIVQQLGAQVDDYDEWGLTIDSRLISPTATWIDCGESGLSARLFTPIAALADRAVRIDGRGSLMHRSMQPFADILPALGVKLRLFNGYLPFEVRGPLRACSITLDGSMSSQYASGILMALSAARGAGEVVEIIVQNPVSQPYLDMTVQVLEHFGNRIERPDIFTYRLVPEGGILRDYVSIEVDWSAIAPLAVAAALGGRVELKIPQEQSLQADAAITDILERVGAIGFSDTCEPLRFIGEDLAAFTHDCTHCPDLIPILTILAAACDGQSRISGLHRLTHKESDRTKTTSALLTALRIAHSIENDAFIITGPQTPRSNTVSGHNDHRIVMAAAIAALRADGPVTIEGAEAVRKSYPAFFDDLQKLGVHVEVSE